MDILNLDTTIVNMTTIDYSDDYRAVILDDKLINTITDWLRCLKLLLFPVICIG